MAQLLTNPTSTQEDMGSIPGLTQWLKVWCCCSCGVDQQLQLRFSPSLGTFICSRCSPKKTKTKQNKKVSNQLDLVQEHFSGEGSIIYRKGTEGLFTEARVLVCVCVCVRARASMVSSSDMAPGHGQSWHKSSEYQAEQVPT